MFDIENIHKASSTCASCLLRICFIYVSLCKRGITLKNLLTKLCAVFRLQTAGC